MGGVLTFVRRWGCCYGTVWHGVAQLGHPDYLINSIGEGLLSRSVDELSMSTPKAGQYRTVDAMQTRGHGALS